MVKFLHFFPLKNGACFKKQMIWISSKVGKVLKSDGDFMWSTLSKLFGGELAQLLCFKSKKLVCIALFLVCIQQL